MANYLVAVGGTGMRCLEAFVNICAIGMFEKQEINVLVIDTDAQNGNREDALKQISRYNEIRKVGKEEVSAGPFFSCQLNVFKYSPNYTNKSFRKLAQLGQQEDNSDDNILSDLLFSENVQDFDLQEGYRAQTNIGSYLMYSSILEEVDKGFGNPLLAKVDGLNSFFQKINQDTEPKVFIVGSIFGGTGASSIPIIPRAFHEALKIIGGGKPAPQIVFGANLLSHYFTFQDPGKAQLKEEKIIAQAARFAVNSKAALMFYGSDHTIRQQYKDLYHLGWPLSPVDYDKNAKGKVPKTKIGGLRQKNPAHIMELFSAFAAYDFFKEADFDVTGKVRHLYRSVQGEKRDGNPHLKFRLEDFLPASNSGLITIFRTRLSVFIEMCLMLEKESDAGGGVDDFITNLGQENKRFKEPYQEITDAQKTAFNQFYKRFLFHFTNEREEVSPEWLDQIQASSTNEEFFLGFSTKVFSTDPNIMKKIRWSEIHEDSRYHWTERKLGIVTRSIYDTFFREFNSNENNGSGKIPSKSLPDLIHDIYKALSSLHEKNA